MLLVSTPLGVLWGIVEAYRFHPWLAGLMAALLTVISIFIGYTVRVIRREQRAAQTKPKAHDRSDTHLST